MKRILFLNVVLAILSTFAVAQSVNVSLPYDLVDTLDGVKFKIRIPANWNGTLLLYMQANKSGPAPEEPLVAPPVLDAAQPSLEQTLLSRGYALAASQISTMDWQVKEEIQDTFALANYFRAKVGNPMRVILWGSSTGGFTALRMIEDYPRSFDAAISLSAPSAGWSRRMDHILDFALAYSVTFGWPGEWGPVEDVRPGLNFSLDVYPRMQIPAADGSNRGQWEFIRLVYGLPPDALYGTCPLYKYPMFIMIMNSSTQMRGDAETWAAGPFVQNRDHRYTLTPQEKTYLASLGVNADDLLAKMNSRANIDAIPISRDFIARFGELRGRLSRPVLTLRNTMDGQSQAAHDSAYRAAVEFWSKSEFLEQRFATGVGHAAFTSKQLLLTLAAMESWLNTGIKPDASFFPTAEGFDNNFVPPPWPY